MRGYSVLGWAVWQLSKRVARYKMRDNRVKLGAAATVLGVIAIGALAAKAASDDES